MLDARVEAAALRQKEHNYCARHGVYDAVFNPHSVIRILWAVNQRPKNHGDLLLNAVSKAERTAAMTRWLAGVSGGAGSPSEFQKLIGACYESSNRRYRNGSQRVSKLIDAVAFRHSHSAPETQLRARPDTRRSFQPQKHAGKPTVYDIGPDPQSANCRKCLSSVGKPIECVFQ